MQGDSEYSQRKDRAVTKDDRSVSWVTRRFRPSLAAHCPRMLAQTKHELYPGKPPSSVGLSAHTRFAARLPLQRP